MALRFLVFAATLATASHASPLDASSDQTPLLSTTPQRPASVDRKLKGRFLHITDIHPDPFYEVYSSTGEDSACHRSKGPAGAYGAETSDCDSPYTLVNATFQWISDNLRDEIDFVVWTGDSARHDNDEKFPRSYKQVLDQNQMLVDKMYEVFGKSGGNHVNDYIVPIIPTFGNNDILPHNIFTPGPNRWTAEYARVWHSFIPEEQRHQFDRGGWFYVEAIPNRLAVFSLNTMYFFDSNAAVDGCGASQPGGEQFQWLRIQLQLLRMRGMKAILTGHVPPARSSDEGGKTSWDESCWQKYALWLRQYRDVVVGSIYGHMNIEHFILQDFADIKWKIAADGLDADSSGLELELAVLQSAWQSDDEKSTSRAHRVSDDVSIAGTEDYLNALREQWRQLPDVAFAFSSSSKNSKGPSKKLKDKIGGEWAERFALSHISASVVPNYFPTLRVIEYNITGLEDSSSPSWNAAQSARPATYEDELPQESDYDSESDDEDDVDDGVDALKHKKHKKKKKKHRKKKKPKKPDFTVPDGPSGSAPPGPAYSPQTLSWTGYTQYYANLTHINNDFTETDGPEAEPREAQRLHDEDGLYQPSTPTNTTAAIEAEDHFVDAQRWRSGKHHAKHPKRPSPHPRPFAYEVEYATSDADDVFELGPGAGGLVVRNHVALASRIGQYRPKQAAADAPFPQAFVRSVCRNLFPPDYARGPCAAAEAQQQWDCLNALGVAWTDDAGWVVVDVHGREVDADRHKKHGKKKHKHKKKKKKKHHGGGGGKKRRIVNRTWYAFVDRATVATLEPDELHDSFGDAVARFVPLYRPLPGVRPRLPDQSWWVEGVELAGRVVRVQWEVVRRRWLGRRSTYAYTILRKYTKIVELVKGEHHTGQEQRHVKT
ncbi:hypothetical protein FH972_022153 [Carpinus fangiana]|uniref:Calcineurin-like phosphoesterase domain-containing protein n=1 Tax=Carpinus fangiana TaxID=176857 RepID=A0A5N6KRZ2_9ROSI|nr:hypothetical protein FH972_022153 [Carpinus fangiana]